jgi:hypothetical protein
MTHTLAVCTVKNSWWWTEELSETCSFIPKKFKKLMHLVCFIIRIYHDACSPECQNDEISKYSVWFNSCMWRMWQRRKFNTSWLRCVYSIVTSNL